MAVRRPDPVRDALATLVPVPRPARWRDLPLPPFEGGDAGGAGGAVDRKGKGKAREVAEEATVETWREGDALLSHSFDLYRVSPLSSFPLAPSASTASFTAFASSFKTYLDRQTSLEDSPSELGIKRVQAGFVNAPLYESTGHPILVEVERGAADGGTVTSLFVLLPPPNTSPSHMNLTLQSVTAVILIDSDSNRLLAKYFEPAHQDPKLAPQFKHPFQTLKEQRAFEAGIFEKTRRATGDILLYQQHLVLYKPSIDLTFFVVGPEGENELMLQGVLNAFYDAVSMLLRHQVEKRAILENLDLVVLALDETVDNGIILETDPVAIASRVSRPKPDAGVNLADITINEQTIMAAFSTVRDKMAQRILNA